MDRRIIIVIAALLLAAGGCVILSQDGGDYAKIIVLKLRIGDHGVSPVSEEIRYGRAPASGLVSGAFRGTFTDGSGRVVQETGIHDPRIRFGDRIGGNGTGNDILTGVVVRAENADLLLIVPFKGTEETFTLTDSATGRTLATTDLRAAVAEFRNAYPEDPQPASPAQEPWSGPLIVPVMLGGVVLVLLFAIVFILMIRRR